MRTSWLLVCLAIAAGAGGCGGGSGPPGGIAEPPAPGSGPAVTWSPARTLLPDGVPYGLDVDGSDRAYVLLDDKDGLALGRADEVGDFAVVRRWPGQSVVNAVVGVDAPGRAIVVWSTGHGLLADVDGRRSWLARGPEVYLAGPTALGVGPDGSATVVWYQELGDRNWLAQRRPGRPTFDPPRPLARGDTDPRVSADGRVVAWEEDAPPDQGGSLVKVAVRSAAGRFGAPAIIHTATAQVVAGASGAGGRVVVAWSDVDQTVHAVERAPGRGAFGSRRTLFTPAEGAQRGIGGVDVAVGARGDATIVWGQQLEENGGRVAAVDWPAGSPPGAPHFVAPRAGRGERQADAHVLNGPHGPLVLFGAFSAGGPTPAARASFAVSPGAWPAQLPDSPHGFDPMFAAGPRGVTAIWTNRDQVRLSRLG